MSSVIGKIFGGGKPKAAKAAPVVAPPPSIDTQAVKQAGDTQRRKVRAAAGRGSTQLTSGSGVTTDAKVGTKKLLGA